MCFLESIGVVYLLGVPCPVRNTAPRVLPVAAVKTTFQPNLAVEAFLPYPVEQLEQRAKNVTVRVVSDRNAASGVIIDKAKNEYFVITNRHVLEKVKTIQVITVDGKTHVATIVKSFDFKDLDLELVAFKSNSIYETARLGKAQDLKIGDIVFATGFPKRSQAWKFAEGQHILSTPQPLQYGYAFGYSSHVEKGMSGGAVMDMYGRVIAINGVHANPLWGKPVYRYADGNKLCEPMQDALANLSWSIPVETVVKSITHLKTTPLATVQQSFNGQVFFNPFIGSQVMPNVLQSRADLALGCTVLPSSTMPQSMGRSLAIPLHPKSNP
jgi:serine protease Do